MGSPRDRCLYASGPKLSYAIRSVLHYFPCGAALPNAQKRLLERRKVTASAKVPAPPHAMTPWLVVVLAVVLFSGALFGYDQGVISGALHGVKKSLLLSPLLIEVVTSWVTLGALFGSLAGGEFADRFGRKHAVILASVLFTAGSLVEAIAPGTLILVVGRLIVGAGVGVAAVAAPLYAAELAPATLRGRFVSAYQLAIAGGIFIAYLVDGWLSKSDAWRWSWAPRQFPVCCC